MRKYLYFADLFDPAYKKRMFAGASRWTARDPLLRPHYAFKEAVLEATIDSSDLEDGAVRYKPRDGNHLGIHWDDNPLNLGCRCNGVRRDISNPALYRSPVIEADWGGGALKVEAEGATFSVTVDENGVVR